MGMGTTTPAFSFPKLNLKGISPQQAAITEAMGGDYGTEEGDKLMAGLIPQVHTYPGMMGLASIGEGIARGVMTNRILANMEGRRAQDQEAMRRYADVTSGGGMRGVAPVNPVAQPSPPQPATSGVGMGQTRPPEAPVPAMKFSGDPDAKPAIVGGTAMAPKPVETATPATPAIAPAAVATAGGMGQTQPQPVQPTQAAPQQPQPNLTVPRQATPTTTQADPRAAMIEAQMAQVDLQREQAAALLQSPNAATRQQGMALMQNLEARRQHLQDQMISFADPTLPLKQRQAEVALAIAEQNAISEKNQFKQIGTDILGNPQYGFVDPVTRTVQPAGGQGVAGGGVGSDKLTALQHLNGDEWLREAVKSGAIPQAVADEIKGYAEGRLPYNPAMAQKPRGQALTALIQQYDPNFDAISYASRNATRKDFTAGNAAKNITALNTAIGHLAQLMKDGTALNNSNFLPSVTNAVGNAVGGQFSGDLQARRTAFDMTKEAAVHEILAALKGSGATVHELEQMAKVINSNSSDASIKAFGQTAIHLFDERLKALADRYKVGMGTTKEPMEVMRAREALNSVMGAKPKAGPAVGDIEDGHRFKGGDPAKPSSWEKVN